MHADITLFEESVIEIVKSIPAGRVLTYGRIAILVGYPNHSRLVGKVLHHHPEAVHMPCHRVVNAAGRLAPGWTAQRPLLENEKVKFKANGCVDLKSALWPIETIQL